MAEEQDSNQTEADIVAGLRELRIAGETVEVREFTFAQELRALQIGEGVIHALSALYSESDEPPFSAIERIFAEHAEALFELLSISTGKDTKWIEALPGREGYLLYLTFWSVNSHFFVDRVVSEQLQRIGDLNTIASVSESSLPPSSTTDTEKAS